MWTRTTRATTRGCREVLQHDDIIISIREKKKWRKEQKIHVLPHHPLTRALRLPAQYSYLAVSVRGVAYCSVAYCGVGEAVPGVRPPPPPYTCSRDGAAAPAPSPHPTTSHQTSPTASSCSCCSPPRSCIHHCSRSHHRLCMAHSHPRRPLNIAQPRQNTNTRSSLRSRGSCTTPCSTPAHSGSCGRTWNRN
ncbi:hypothetical protein C8J57DRAFT_1370756 [Mycena rebaudengoi]|nr:hypothetical protein C8J57DRAFT_1370756 [Mycena rebaudengoi]